MENMEVLQRKIREIEKRHLQPMRDTKPVKQVWESKVQRKKKMGRRTLHRIIGETLQKKEMTW